MATATMRKWEQGIELDATVEYTVTIDVEGSWLMNGSSMNPGTYKLEFKRNSPSPLARIVIDPDPGGGRV